MEDSNSFLPVNQFHTTLAPFQHEPLLAGPSHESVTLQPGQLFLQPRRSSYLAKNVDYDRQTESMAGDRTEHIQLPELMSPTKSVFVRDCMEKVKVKRSKYAGKRHSEQRSEKLNGLAAKSVDKPQTSQHISNRENIRTRIMHYQWSNEFPQESHFKGAKKKVVEKDHEQALRYPDLSLFLSMLHNNKISDATKVKRIYGK